MLISAEASADDTQRSASRWSGFTTEQLAEHLGLEGGNISFEFDAPVFFQIKVTERKAGDEEPEVVLDDWTDDPSTRYDLFVKVEDASDRVDRVHKKVSVEYLRYDRTPIDEPGVTGEQINDESRGFTMNAWFDNEDGLHRHDGAWRNLEAEARVGEPVTVYELVDGHAADDVYYRVDVRFAESLPDDAKDGE
ncbi:MAG: hypothetical protein WD118_02305 [Phycisphaeraceae bacterium]